jgi:uncharacterized protein YbjT (DUF2867 family)
MTILITGATGTIGSQATKALLAAKASVRVGLRDPAKGAALAKAGAQVVRFDFEDASTYADAFADVERVFLLTPFIEHFVPHVQRAAEAAKAAGVKFIVRMSAFGADPDAADGLSKHHGQAEEAVKATGLQWTVLRPTFFQDNVLTYQSGAVAQGSVYGASHGGQVAYISSKDVGEVVAQVLLDPSAHVGETYELTGPAAVTDESVAAELSKAAGKPVAYVDLTGDQLMQGQLGAGTPHWMAEHLVALEGVKAAGWAAEVSDAVPSILGRPAESYASFVQRHAARLR